METHEQENRWGGVLLAAGSVGYLVTIILYVAVYGRPEGTGPEGVITLGDKAAHMLANWSMVKTMWLAEFLATVMLAIAAFMLSDRRYGTKALVPGRFAWTLVGVAALSLLPMYALMLGGYPVAAEVVTSQPQLFGMVDEITLFIFHAGNALLFAGFAAAFHAESRGGTLPGWLGMTGVLLALVAAVSAVALLLGAKGLAFLAPLGLLSFLLVGYLGFAIARRGSA